MLPDLLLAMVILVIYVFLLLIRSCYNIGILSKFSSSFSLLIFISSFSILTAKQMCLSYQLLCNVLYSICFAYFCIHPSPVASCEDIVGTHYSTAFLYIFPLYISLFSNAANSFLPVIISPCLYFLRT
jgi:hypothetical protein